MTTIALKPPENNFLIREIHDQPIKEDNFEPLNEQCVMCLMMFTANYHLNRTNTVTLILHWEEYDTKRRQYIGPGLHHITFSVTGSR